MSTIILYKYRAINDWSLESLRSGQMWFSLKHGASNSFAATEQFVQKFLSSANARDRMLFVIALVHFLREQGLSSQVIADNLALGGDSELRENLESDLREAYSRNQEFGNSFGVLSLSGRNDDPLMWAHYGDSCKGMCVGVAFDVDELVQSDFIPLWVEYAKELQLLSASLFFDRRPDNKNWLMGKR